MKTFWTLLTAAALAVAAWRFSHRRPPDLSEAQAQEKALGVLEDFCLGEKIVCPNFTLKGQFPPTDPRFSWAFHYEKASAEDGQKIIVSVGKKGDFTLEMTALPPPSEVGAAP